MSICVFEFLPVFLSVCFRYRQSLCLFRSLSVCQSVSQFHYRKSYCLFHFSTVCLFFQLSTVSLSVPVIVSQSVSQFQLSKILLSVSLFDSLSVCFFSYRQSLCLFRSSSVCLLSSFSLPASSRAFSDFLSICYNMAGLFVCLFQFCQCYCLSINDNNNSYIALYPVQM